MELLPYQEEDVAKACGKWRDRPVYFGHDMGLGKCCMAITAWQRLEAKKILIVCPASVRSVWRGEVEKWTDRPYKVQSITTNTDKIDETAHVVIVSYTLAASKPVGSQLLRKWDVIVFDECHALGDPSSRRTKMCLGSLYPRGKKCLFLSGSIQRDKIVNVWPVFRTLCPLRIPRYQNFISEYVTTKETNYGTVFTGGKNLKKLGDIARRHFLLRRRKKDVLKDLPEKLEQKLMIELPGEEQARAEEAYNEFNDDLQKALIRGYTVNNPAIASLYRETGEAKVDVAMETIANLLGLGVTEESCGKLVVFCYNHTVFSMLKDSMKDMDISVASLSGRSSDKARQEAIRSFQESDIQVFLGTFAAAEGITLTAANTCLFVQMSWTLSQNEQAPDRLHRIGQKNTVYVKYLLLENSLDITVYNCYKRKSGDKKKLLEEVE